ncbi:ileal sodium/bile acid cotransporter-like [Schistocerca nitens]|uniref:ileal sodium/bile acid cotransporter-like n=1 Tax=Schistocerca nitens TaxID=7011 RepID=UPI0021192AB5|nr:ileal sodium/bile acid cotransporter-like [Schistocerca nitens]
MIRWLPLLLAWAGCLAAGQSPDASDSGWDWDWQVQFFPELVGQLPSDSSTWVDFNSSDLSDADRRWGVVTVASRDPHIAKVTPESTHYTLRTQHMGEDGVWSSAFEVSGVFLGHTTMWLQMHNNSVDGPLMRRSPPVPVTVVRPDRAIDHAFNYSVAILASIIYINFGCALDLAVLTKTLRRPIGPVIGLVSQFLFMPLISYVLGLILFPSSAAMQLGLFFTGTSPAGGASNIWTYALDGNINLSITMTTISTFAAFAMMPLWIFSLGHTIFAQAQITIPYVRIGTIAFGLLIPLFIGLLLQRFLPKVSKFMVKILKPFAALLIIFIVIFAIITNYYLFHLFSWQILLAGMGLPWIGFFSGFLAARVLRQPSEDIIAIAIETGVQNTGIAIFMLRFSLGQPEADLTTVVPVAVAVLTPVPLIILIAIRRLRRFVYDLSRPGPELEPLGQQNTSNKLALITRPVTEVPTSHP